MNPFYPYQQQQQPQSGALIIMRSEDDIRRYPIAPGNSLMFKIEGQPILYEKSMGFSQLDSPSLKRFRLVEDTGEEQKDDIRNAIEELRKELAELKKEEE